MQYVGCGKASTDSTSRSVIDVIGTGNRDIGQVVPSGILQYCRIDVRLRLPVIPEKVVYPGDEALCLVLSQVGRSEKLATDVGFRHGVGVIQCNEQSRVSESPQSCVKTCQAGEYLRPGSSRSDQVYRYRMLRVYEIVVDVVYSFISVCL